MRLLRRDARFVDGFSTWAPGAVKPIGSTDPGRRNVGPRLRDLKVINGDVTLTTGDVIQGLDIYGKLIFTGKARALDCVIRGPVWGQGPTWVAGTPTNDAAVNSTYNGRDSVLEWCRLDGTGRENVWTDGIRGNNFTMRYSEVTRFVDGFGAISGSYYGPTLLENNRLHNSYYTAWLNSLTGTVYPNFPSSPSDRRAHNDGVQMQGFRDYTLRGNYIGGGRAPGVTSTMKQNNRDYLLPAHQAVIAAVNAADDFGNSALMIQNNATMLAFIGVLIELNWLTGGDATVNFSAANTLGDDLRGAILRNNRFIRQSTFGASDGYSIFLGSNANPTLSGNVWDDTGTPVPIVINTETFTSEVTKPGPYNTGVPAGTTLTTVVGDITTTADGQVIDGKDVFGFIIVQHANVTIRNCRVRGRDTGAAYIIGGLTLPGTPSGTPSGDGAYARAIPSNTRSLINGDSAVATNLRIERCTLAPDYPAWWLMGVYLRGGTATRCNISGVGDGVEVRGGACTVTDNYVHDLIFFDNDYDHRTSSPAWWSHNDGVMVQGGSGTLIAGNFFDMLMTGSRVSTLDANGYPDRAWGAGVTVAATQSAVNNLTVRKNWFKSGAAGYQANQTNTAAGWTGASDVVGTVTGNRFTHDQHEVPVASSYQIRYANAAMITDNTGNIWDGDASVMKWNPAKPGTAMSVGFATGIRIP